MKRILTLALAAILAASTLASCASAPTESASTSSAAYADEAWLETRLGDIPDGVTVGTADELGLEMTDFEDDGYFIRTRCGETVVCGKTAEGLDLAVRKYAKWLKYGASVCDTVYHEGARIERLTIAGRDVSEYTVVYTHTETPLKLSVGVTVGNGEAAATEFVRLMKEATGVALPMLDLSGGAPLPEHYILFDADDTGGDFSSPTGYEYKAQGGNLIFRGSGIENGCLNGVWYFFEHVLGWTGLTYGDAILAEAEYIDVPADLYRRGELMFEHFVEAHCDGDRLLTKRDVSYLGIYNHAGHGMHRNGFAGDGIDAGREQPCLCDWEQYEIIRDNVVRYIEGHIALGQRPGIELNYVDLAHGDNREWCECRECRKALKEEGSQSGPWLRMVNHVAEDLGDKYPGIRYLMFAYEGTKCPPKKTRPNDLVNVTFCTDGMCYNHSLDSGECLTATFRSDGVKNDTYAKWIETWVSMTKWVDVWYYAMDGAFQQYDIFETLFADVKYLKSVGVRGIYMEGEYYGMGTGRLNHEMLPVLQWEPDITWDEYAALSDGFIERDYGEDFLPAFRAAQALISASAHGAGCKTCWYEADFVKGNADYAFMGEHMEEVLARIDEAMRDAPSALAEKRAKRLTLCILYEGVYGRYFPALEAGDEAELAHLGELYALFCSRAAECGYDLTAYPLGWGAKRAISPDLAVEARLWADAKWE